MTINVLADVFGQVTGCRPARGIGAGVHLFTYFELSPRMANRPRQFGLAVLEVCCDFSIRRNTAVDRSQSYFSPKVGVPSFW
jgi:hypothetical protein